MEGAFQNICTNLTCGPLGSHERAPGGLGDCCRHVESPVCMCQCEHSHAQAWGMSRPLALVTWERQGLAKPRLISNLAGYWGPRGLRPLWIQYHLWPLSQSADVLLSDMQPTWFCTDAVFLAVVTNHVVGLEGFDSEELVWGSQILILFGFYHFNLVRPWHNYSHIYTKSELLNHENMLWGCILQHICVLWHSDQKHCLVIWLLHLRVLALWNCMVYFTLAWFLQHSANYV